MNSCAIITLFVVGILALIHAAPAPEPGYHGHHEHVVIHVPYQKHTVHHHHVKKVYIPHDVHHIEKVPVHIPVPVHHVEKVIEHVPVHIKVPVEVPVPVKVPYAVPVPVHEHHHTSHYEAPIDHGLSWGHGHEASW